MYLVFRPSLPIYGYRPFKRESLWLHYGDVIMSAMVSQTTSLTIVYRTFYSGADERKHQSSALLAFVWGIHRRPVNSQHKGPVARKIFPFDDVIMDYFSIFTIKTVPGTVLLQSHEWEHQELSFGYTDQPNTIVSHAMLSGGVI